MTLLALGINHRTAPVNVREQVSFAPEKLGESLQQLHGIAAVNEAMIVSTCNRTEIYCDINETQIDTITQWLSECHQISRDQISPYLYSHLEQDAIRHLLRVASGLDSLVLGEPQILGQIKSAYNDAKHANTVGPIMDRLLQHTFAVAKRVRTDTEIGSSPVSVAFAAVSLAKQIFGDLTDYKALLIGAGETIELAARHLHGNGIKQIIVANRTFEKAHHLASEFGGYGIALEEMADHLHEADIVIGSTASPVPVLGKGTVERALKKRKHRPMFMVDIAVPRDIEAEVADLDDVYLYTVDDLQGVIEENMKNRQQAAEQAEKIIESQVDHFIGYLKSREAFDIIRQYRGEAEIMRNEVLQKAQAMLNQGKTAEEALTFLANTLTNKLLHGPTTKLRQTYESGCPELIAAARTLFNLQDK